MRRRKPFKTNNPRLECLHKMFGIAFAKSKYGNKRKDCPLTKWPYEELRSTCLSLLKQRVIDIDCGEWVDVGLITAEYLAMELDCYEHDLVPLIEALSLDLTIPYELESETNMCSCCEHIDLVKLKIKRHISAQKKCLEYLKRVNVKHKRLLSERSTML